MLHYMLHYMLYYMQHHSITCSITCSTLPLHALLHAPLVHALLHAPLHIHYILYYIVRPAEQRQHQPPRQACRSSSEPHHGIRRAPAGSFWHRHAAVQVHLQCSSENFSMLGIELDTACQQLLQLRLGNHLRRHQQKCQAMYANKILCMPIKHKQAHTLYMSSLLEKQA